MSKSFFRSSWKAVASNAFLWVLLCGYASSFATSSRKLWIPSIRIKTLSNEQLRPFFLDHFGSSNMDNDTRDTPVGPKTEGRRRSNTGRRSSAWERRKGPRERREVSSPSSPEKPTTEKLLVEKTTSPETLSSEKLQMKELSSTSSSESEKTHIVETSVVESQLSELKTTHKEIIVEQPKVLDEKQLDFVIGYLNKHHGRLLTKIAENFSQLGIEKKKKNAWSGGSFEIISSKIVNINTTSFELDVDLQERREGIKTKRVTIDLDATPVVKSRKFGSHHGSNPTPSVARDLNLKPIDEVVRRLIRMCWMLDEPEATGKLFQLGIQLGGSKSGKIKDNMYLNQCPHNRYVRQYFYEMASDAVLEAVIQCSKGRISNRMKLTAMFPEMNPSMDSYRIGTILEMIRVIAIKLVEQNLRVRICVQGSMGVGIFTGVPKQLGGVSKLLQMMDWQSEEGEENEGMVGDYLNFGHVGAEHVVNAHVREDGTKVEKDDVFILIAPQSMVGVDSSIIGPLKEMTEAAGDRPIILLNPDLIDKPSAQGQQNVRGRQGRIDFANSFKTIWHFENIYVSGTSYFPILGAMFKPGPLSMWSAYQRRDLANNEGEVYIPMLAGEGKPQGDQILESFKS